MYGEKLLKFTKKQNQFGQNLVLHKNSCFSLVFRLFLKVWTPNNTLGYPDTAISYLLPETIFKVHCFKSLTDTKKYI